MVNDFMKKLTKNRAEEYFNYDQNSGKFFFKERNKIDFNNNGSYTQHIKRIGREAGSIKNDGYVDLLVDKNFYKAHRVAWLIVYGSFPILQIDHINGIRSDNRIDNLREVKNITNSHNSGKRLTNTSGHNGISWNSKRKKMGSIYYD